MQSPNSILMVRPANFAFNPMTAKSNNFQSRPKDTHDLSIEARLEFDTFYRRLVSAGITVHVFDDNNSGSPDAVFPNNWISFHEDGKVVIYPMMAENRRKEKNMRLITELEKKFNISGILDLSRYESENKFLEGTGSIIFDHANKVAYANYSDRTSEYTLDICCRELGYEPVIFHAKDREGKDIYHTNVLMALADEFCVICLESIDESERSEVVSKLEKSGREIVDISLNQLANFAGNMIQLTSSSAQKYMVMSESAYRSLNPGQLDVIKKSCEPLYSNLHTIETVGGGSARCMIAGIFLPAKKLISI